MEKEEGRGGAGVKWLEVETSGEINGKRCVERGVNRRMEGYVLL